MDAFNSSQEDMQFFDEIAKAELGITAEEFLKRYNAGQYTNIDVDSVPGLDEVLACLPFAAGMRDTGKKAK